MSERTLEIRQTIRVVSRTARCIIDRQTDRQTDPSIGEIKASRINRLYNAKLQIQPDSTQTPASNP